MILMVMEYQVIYGKVQKMMVSHGNPYLQVIFIRLLTKILED